MAAKVNPQALGELIRQARENAGLSLREAARRAKIHPSYLSKIELGQVPPPTWEKVMRLGNVLNSQQLWFQFPKVLHDEIMEHRRALRLLSERLPKTLNNIKATPDMRDSIAGQLRELADRIQRGAK